MMVRSSNKYSACSHKKNEAEPRGLIWKSLHGVGGEIKQLGYDFM